MSCNPHVNPVFEQNLTAKDLDWELVQDIRKRMILHWNYRNLTELPKELLDHGEHIREIYLKRNNIMKLPENIGCLKNLTNLYLASNQLNELPQQIDQLQSLQVLDVSQNNLTTVPCSIGNLEKLEKLILTQNRICLLPVGMKKLKKLRFLELSNNQLRMLSDEMVSGWQSLEEIGMDRNPMKFLPKKLSSLHNLKTVSACKCNLRYLPSLPFYSLVHGPRCFDGYYNYGETSFQFRFDGNENLNYIPYWLLQLIGAEIDSFGCGTSQEETPVCDFPHVSFCIPTFNATVNNTTCTRNRFFIYFDPSIRQVETSGHNCLSLLEVCLKHLYRNQNVETHELKEKRLSGELPNDLKTLLLSGPVSHCFQCMTPIFTQVCPLVFTLILPDNGDPPNDGVLRDYNDNLMRNQARSRLHFGCVLFCNFLCKQKFITNDVSRSNLQYQDLNFIKENEIVLC